MTGIVDRLRWDELSSGALQSRPVSAGHYLVAAVKWGVPTLLALAPQTARR